MVDGLFIQDHHIICVVVLVNIHFDVKFFFFNNPFHFSSS